MNLKQWGLANYFQIWNWISSFQILNWNCLSPTWRTTAMYLRSHRPHLPRLLYCPPAGDKRSKLDWTPKRCKQKTNLPTNQKGYNTFETTDKLSARRIQICFKYFCKIHFWPLIFWNKWNQGPNKNSQSRCGFASSNTRLLRSQTLLRCLGSMANYFFT